MYSIEFGKKVIIQQDNEPKHNAYTTKDFIRENRVKSFRLSQSPDLNPTNHAFHPLKRRLMGELLLNKQ